MSDKSQNLSQERGSWGSNFGFLMAAVGSAVGLGNIWGFPYKMGRYGGFAFLIVYLLLVVFVGAVVMLGELTIGRKTGLGAVGAYGAFNKKHKWVGYIGVASAFFLLTFYNVLGGLVIPAPVGGRGRIQRPGDELLDLHTARLRLDSFLQHPVCCV